MPASYQPPSFEGYVPPPTTDGMHAPVVIVGAGPVGLCCAIDLALYGVKAIVIDDNNTVSTGSRAICYAKRTLEILDRLGCGDAVVDRGVGWRVGKVFVGDRLAYQFDLLPEDGHRRPAFVNLQQYHLEEALLARLAALGGEVRWKNRCAGVTQDDDGVTLEVESPGGTYRLRADRVIAADGARSTVREAMGLAFDGQVFNDRFLIADVRMTGDFPTERWFWFDPPFHRHQSVLLHRQADDVWRIDFQLGPDADAEDEKRPERVLPRLRAMLGSERPFTLEWVSVYTFQCRRLERFVHERVIFAGDAAHQVSPFGARGCNGGIQDADNLCWKLARVVKAESPVSLLASYDHERGQAADENILESTRSTDFITPKSDMSRVFRDSVLALAAQHEFARRLVNSGRLSLPARYRDSALDTQDRDAWDSPLTPGTPLLDAPVTIGGAARWLSAEVGHGFDLLVFGDRIDLSPYRAIRGVRCIRVIEPGAAGDDTAGERVIVDTHGLLARRYGAAPGSAYLIRPDQHVAARWKRGTPADVAVALARACGASSENSIATDHHAQSRAA